MLSHIASRCHGLLSPDDTSVAVKTVSSVDIDSRRLHPSGLFVALPGTNSDGHEYLPQALAARAAAAVVERFQPSPLPQIKVAHAETALINLASYWRSQLTALVVAVTGSNGKTTVKEMLSAIGRVAYGAEKVHCTSGNFNNQLGVPLTILATSENKTLLVAEAGMDMAGELHRLSVLLKPHFAIINNAQQAHIGHFDTLTDVARAKGELLVGLAAGGSAILNADDPHFSLWQALSAGRKIMSFGFSPAATVRGTVTAAGFCINRTLINLSLPGRHNQYNALAAAAAALAMGLPMSTINAGISSFAGITGRLQMKPWLTDSLLIDDTYNANPDSAAAALAVLQETAAARSARPILVMGDMLALGQQSAAAHVALVMACRQANVLLFGFGSAMAEAISQQKSTACQSFADQAAIVEQLQAAATKDSLCVLVKGSRGMAMEAVVSALLSGTTT